MNAVFADWNSETQLAHSLGGGCCEEILEMGCSKPTNSHFLFSGKIFTNTNQQPFAEMSNENKPGYFEYCI